MSVLTIASSVNHCYVFERSFHMAVTSQDIEEPKSPQGPIVVGSSGPSCIPVLVVSTTVHNASIGSLPVSIASSPEITQEERPQRIE